VLADPVEPGVDPHVTSIITEELLLAQQLDPDLTGPVIGDWQPDQPYTYERISRRTPAGDQQRDILSVTPAQFRATSTRQGDLRRFRQLVFEVTYLDPRNASAAMLADTTPPSIEKVELAAQRARLAGPLLTLSARVADPGGIAEVRAALPVDNQSWIEQPLTYNQASGRYELTIDHLPLGSKPYVIVSARDTAGNVATYIARGLPQPQVVFLPIVQH
jgi:hypothetical protein